MQKKLIFFTFLLFIKSLFCSSALNHFYNSPWHFIEDTFIVKPKNKFTSAKNRIFRWGTTGIFAIGSLYIANRFTNYAKENYFEDDESLFYIEEEKNIKIISLLIHMFGTAIASLIFLKLINSFTAKKIEQDMLRNFVINWLENKSFTPKELQEAFEVVHNLYKNNKRKFDEETSEIIRLTKNAIYNQFPKKYEITAKKEKFFDTKIFTSDLSFGDILNGIANLICAIKN